MSLFPGRIGSLRADGRPSVAFWRHSQGERGHGGHAQLPRFLGGFTLVRLADLDLEYLPPAEPDGSLTAYAPTGSSQCSSAGCCARFARTPGRP